MKKTIFTAASLLAAHASAQTLEEIVVVGELRDAALDELPASISVLSGDMVEQRSATHLEEMLGLAANVNVSSGASRSRYFQIRGIGERGQFAEPLNPSVGVLVDGADISTAAGAATLFDVDQIEVFRGPQGTRYGANALAGLINIKTREPTDELEARFGVDLENYDSATIHGAVAGPLGESLAGRIAVQQHRSDGYIENTFLGSDRTNERDELSLRGKLRWEATPDLVVNALLGRVDVDNGYDAFSLDNDRFTRSDEPGRDAQESTFAVLDASWSGAERFTVQSIVSAALSDSVYGYDEDWTYTGFHPFGYSSTDYYYRDRRTVSGEMRVISGERGRIFGGTTDWAVGLYALQTDVDLLRDYTFLAAPFTSSFAIDRQAVFGQLDTALTAQTNLTAGVRFERHESDYRDSANVAFAPSDDLEGWRLGIDHQVTDNLMAYGLVAGGYKAGGFNTDGTLDEDLREFDPETTASFEIGVKGVLADGRLGLRVAAFTMRRDDVQIASSVTRLRADGSTEFIDFIGNAADGSNSGMEMELSYAATDRLGIDASIGLLRSEYESFINAAGENLDGREQAHAPGYQFAVSGIYELAGDWYVEAGLEGRDAFYFSASHDERSDAYMLVNAALGFERGGWRVRLWARNLTDEDTWVRGYYFGNDPRIDYAARGYTQLGEPRRVGLSLSRAF